MAHPFAVSVIDDNGRARIRLDTPTVPSMWGVMPADNTMLSSEVQGLIDELKKARDEAIRRNAPKPQAFYR